MKPRVVIVADVKTWAWARKSAQLQQHLGDEFDIRVVYQYERPPDVIPSDFDLLHTYEVMQAMHLAPTGPFTTGITAHVWPGHERNHGRDQLVALMGRARAVHANSVLLVEETRRRYGVTTRYCPNGVDERFFRRLRDDRPRDRLVVGWVGKPSQRKEIGRAHV